MKKLLALLVILSMVVVTAACAATAPEGGGVAGGGAAAVPVAGGGSFFRESTVDPFTDPIRIAWIPTNAPDPNGTGWGRGIEQELSYWPNASFYMFDGERDSERQVRIMQDLIVQGFNAIIVQAFNSAALAPAVAEAEAAGIPVITINIGTTIPHAGHVAMTDFEAGYVIANRMAEAVGGVGNFVAIQATPGAARGENLEAGFQHALQSWPDITIIDAQTGEWLAERSHAVMTDFLTRHDRIDGVFAHNDQMAQGAALAVQAAGRLGEMVIWGANGESGALEFIEQGLMTGTIYTNVMDQGRTAARLAMMYIGSNIDTSQFTQTPVIKMPPIAVTIENVHTITPEMRW